MLFHYVLTALGISYYPGPGKGKAVFFVITGAKMVFESNFFPSLGVNIYGITNLNCPSSYLAGGDYVPYHLAASK